MSTFRWVLLGSWMVVFAAPLLGEDLEAVFARYAAATCVPGAPDPSPQRAFELMAELDRLTADLLLDLSADGQPRALWWDGRRQAVGARVDDWTGVLATGVDSCERVAFASELEPGAEPRVTGWLDTFERRLLVQVSFDGRLTRAIVTPDAGSSGGPLLLIMKDCICAGRAARCVAEECEARSACGNDSKGTCRWIDRTPPTPAPPPTGSGCGAVNGVVAVLLFACPYRAIARRWVMRDATGRPTDGR